MQGERARLQALLLNKDRTIARLARENRWDNLLLLVSPLADLFSYCLILPSFAMRTKEAS